MQLAMRGMERERPAASTLCRWFGALVAAVFVYAAMPVLPATAASDPCPIKPSADPGEIPVDVCKTYTTPDQLSAFDNMAWQTFKMLVWPARMTDEQGRSV